MAAPVAGSLILSDDSSNTGDKLRTQTRVVGGNTVHEYFFRPVLGVTLTGRYWFALTGLSIFSTADNGITTGFQWFINPVGSTVVAVLRRLIFDCSNRFTTASPAAAVISVRKFTFTGTGVSRVATLTSSTGSVAPKSIFCGGSLTLTLGSEITNFQVPACESATSTYWGAKEAYPFNPLAFGRGSDIEFAPGEGFVVYQPIAGVASDTRMCTLSGVWDEFDPS